MSLARNIYDYIARSENRSVDQALLLAWQRAEEPYRTALLEAILERGKSSATLRLIEQFHLFSSQTQKVLAERAKSLYGGLFLGARSPAPQTKQNTLTIIGRGNYLPLAEMVCSMLRDRDRQISQQAGEVLLGLSNGFVLQNSGYSPVGHCESRAEGRGSEAGQGRSLQQVLVNKRLIVSALDKALYDFEVHQRVEAILSAMQIIPANQKSFWRDRLAQYHSVGKAIRRILLTYDRPDIVGFCVSALSNMSLRATAAKAIATHQRPDYLSRVAIEVSRQSNRSVLLGLKLVREPRWLAADRFEPDRMPARAQEALVLLVRRLHGVEEDKAAYLAAIAETGCDSAGRKAIVALSRMEEQIARSSLDRLVRSDCEPVAVAAAEQMRKKKWPQFHALMLEQYSHGSGKLHELAHQYLRELAFDRYWEIFDRLPPATRLSGGRAVYKIDPDAHARWCKKARDPSPVQRLRAVRQARYLGRVDACVEEFLSLCRDRDSKVRSCATAGLGELRQDHEGVLRQLVRALSDADSRVRANAIESLEQRPGEKPSHELFRYVQDAHHRVRANAIKALLHWKVASARQAIAQMLSDPRPQHRISAQWVASQGRRNENDSEGSPGPERAHCRVRAVVPQSL